MMKYLMSTHSLDDESPHEVRQIVVPESMNTDLRKLMAEQPDTLDEELDQSSLQTFEKMYMQDDLCLNDSYNQTTVIHRDITE